MRFNAGTAQRTLPLGRCMGVTRQRHRSPCTYGMVTIVRWHCCAGRVVITSLLASVWVEHSAFAPVTTPQAQGGHAHDANRCCRGSSLSVSDDCSARHSGQGPSRHANRLHLDDRDPSYDRQRRGYGSDVTVGVGPGAKVTTGRSAVRRLPPGVRKSRP